MKVWTDKEGNKLTAKEFMARWKEGIQKITPLQQKQTQVNGYFIVLIGELFGLYYGLSTAQWWLATILFGSFMISKAALTGTYQQKLLFEKMFGKQSESINNEKGGVSVE